MADVFNIDKLNDVRCRDRYEKTFMKDIFRVHNGRKSIQQIPKENRLQSKIFELQERKSDFDKDQIDKDLIVLLEYCRYRLENAQTQEEQELWNDRYEQFQKAKEHKKQHEAENLQLLQTVIEEIKKDIGFKKKFYKNNKKEEDNNKEIANIQELLNNNPALNSQLDKNMIKQIIKHKNKKLDNKTDDDKSENNNTKHNETKLQIENVTNNERGMKNNIAKFPAQRSVNRDYRGITH